MARSLYTLNDKKHYIITLHIKSSIARKKEYGNNNILWGGWKQGEVPITCPVQPSQPKLKPQSSYTSQSVQFLQINYVVEEEKFV